MENFRKLNKTAAFAIALLPIVALARPACQVSDIVVDRLNVVNEGNLTTRILGRVSNNCAKPTGVQLKVVFYGKGRDLLKVVDMWPASVNNIPPHSNFPFDIPIERLSNIEKTEASVIQVKTW
jgi:hypothetical protein